jgi:uncharacterized protein (TIGR03437 family)
MKVSSIGLALAMGCAFAAAPAPISYTIDTVAGSSAVGDGGPALSAALSDAEGIALDSAGNIFVADANDHRVRRIATDGTISTVAGDGFPGFRGDGGPASAARLNTPYGITVDRAGNLYIADLGNNRVRKVSPDGTIATVPGTDSLLAPRNVALDPEGVLYISEFGGHRVRRLRADRTVESVVGTGEPGFAGDGGPATSAQLAYPAGLAFDTAGDLYIADSSNNRVRKVTGGVISTVLGTGDPGATVPNQLNLPTSVAIDAAGNLDVADSGNQRIQQLAPAGAINTIPGVGRDLAADTSGGLFIASGAQVLELAPSLTIQTVAGDGSYGFRGDGGDAASARLNGPVAVALDAAGALYIADQRNSRLRMVTAAGVISTIAGDSNAGAGDGQLNSPAGIAVGSSGAVYVADQNNDRIQEIAGSGSVIRAAGTGVPGYNGDGLPASATQLFSPGALAIKGDGTLYFVDTGNARVRALSPQRTISTVVKIAARSVALGRAGDLFVADGELHQVVRLDLAGHMTVIAGTGTPGFGGDGGSARAAHLNSPGGLAVDPQGNLYIADTGNDRIRVIGSDGIIRTIAGTGAAGFDGDGGPALSAVLNAPTGLTVDAAGNIWIADTANNRVRKLAPSPVASPDVTPPAIVNAASMLAGPVAPGEIVSIFGSDIGPAIAVSGALDPSGVLSGSLAETQVLFDGVRAPLLYVHDGQINAQAPYEISEKSAVDVEVFYKGESRGKISVPTAAAAPGIFTTGGGTGQAAAVNQDATLNSLAHPALRGSVITFYATGEGITKPAGADGKSPATVFPKPLLPVTLSVGDYPAQILFAGEASSFAGLMQVKVRLPGNSTPAGSLPVVLRIGTASSQAGVTISVR